MLGVSSSGYYAWKIRPESRRKQEDKALIELIKRSHERSRQTYGYRRTHQDVIREGKLVGKERIRRLMKRHGMTVKTKKKFKVTTDSNHSKPIYDNKLNRDFTASGVNQRWVSDMTYIPTMEGWLYLAIIMDLFSRKVVGWAMDARMKESLTIDALRMALIRRKITASLLLHSDRGSQYAANHYQDLLRMNRITCSMSRKGDCWDNAAMESFFHTLKVELIHHELFKTRQEAKQSIFEYIEVFYNRQRRHSAINYESPERFELMHAC